MVLTYVYRRSKSPDLEGDMQLGIETQTVWGLVSKMPVGTKFTSPTLKAQTGFKSEKVCSSIQYLVTKGVLTKGAQYNENGLVVYEVANPTPPPAPNYDLTVKGSKSTANGSQRVAISESLKTINREVSRLGFLLANATQTAKGLSEVAMPDLLAEIQRRSAK
jgi:hypothetical protein